MTGWQLAKLGDLTNVISSGATPLGGASKYNGTGPVLFIRSQNVLMNHLDVREAAYISEEDDRQLARTRVAPGDVLLNITGASIGRVSEFQLQGVRANVNQHVCVIRPKPDRLSSGFLSRYISSPRCQSYINRIQAGGTRQALNFSQIADFQIPLPPVPEQRRIAAVLDEADALRAKRRAALAQLDTLNQSIFVDMFGDPTVNSKAWPDATRLSDVAEISSGVTKGRNLASKVTRSIPYMAVLNVQDKRLDLSLVKTIEATEDEIRRYRLVRDDLLMTEGGDPDKLGRGALWQENLPDCIHQNHIFRVRITAKTAVNPVFLNWLVGSERGKRYFLRSAKQTTGIASINMTQLRAFPLLLPPIALQVDFARRVATVEGMKATVTKAGDELDALFVSLQQRAFRGEL